MIAKRKAKSTPDHEIAAFKGFDSQLKCRGYQYEIGKTYTHDAPVEKCASGFHSCEYPLDVFGYYPPVDDSGQLNRFASVRASGAISRDNSDSKIASASIQIDAEIRIPQLIEAAISYTLVRTRKSKSKISNNHAKRSIARNSGERSVASNSGGRSVASNSGRYSVASNSGRYSVASNSGWYSVASNSGRYSVASNSGWYSVASIESWVGVNAHAIALAAGYQSKAKASAGSAIVCVYRNDKYELVHIRAAIAGKDVKADTWYTLDAKGDFEESA